MNYKNRNTNSWKYQAVVTSVTAAPVDHTSKWLKILKSSFYKLKDHLTKITFNTFFIFLWVAPLTGIGYLTYILITKFLSIAPHEI